MLFWISFWKPVVSCGQTWMHHDGRWRCPAAHRCVVHFPTIGSAGTAREVCTGSSDVPFWELRPRVWNCSGLLKLIMFQVFSASMRSMVVQVPMLHTGLDRTDWGLHSLLPSDRLNFIHHQSGKPGSRGLYQTDTWHGINIMDQRIHSDFSVLCWPFFSL